MLWEVLCISPCYKQELPDLQSTLDYEKSIMMVSELVYPLPPLSLFNNKLECQYLEYEFKILNSTMMGANEYRFFELKQRSS